MNSFIQHFTIVTNILSILFILITFVFTFTYQSTITRRQLLHWNLVQLMRNLGFCWVITLTGTLLVLVSFLLDNNLLETPKLIFNDMAPYSSFQLVSIIGACGSGSAFAAIVMERCIASCRLKSYEKEKHPKLIILTILSTWSFSVYIGNYLFVSDLGGAWIFYISLFAMIALSAVLGIFVYNHYWNLRKYLHAKKHRLAYSLSQRFQLSENIRMSRLLFRGISAASIGGFISSVFLLGCFHANMGRFSDMFYFWRALFIFALMVTSLAYIITACIYLPFWKELFIDRWILRNRRNPNTDNSHLQSLEGQKFAFSIPIETTMHFEHLKDSWAVRTKA